MLGLAEMSRGPCQLKLMSDLTTKMVRSDNFSLHNHDLVSNSLVTCGLRQEYGKLHTRTRRGGTLIALGDLPTSR
jgi:hypothetical protein